MAQELADWSELQYDLLVLIARHLNLIEDYLNFGSVCKSWHSVPTKNNFNKYLSRAPWLMLAEEDGNSIRKFFSLYNGMILNKRIPKASRKRCMESMGWLIMVGEDQGEISMLHPFSGVQIELPPSKYHRRLPQSSDWLEDGLYFQGSFVR
uniref:Putative ovule protein n=1 Tax=Solanum chacoense TaxID=4108 RepID=A0A0V0H671_SOLCH